MTTPHEIKNMLLKALSSMTDRSLKQAGFLREMGTMTYSRTLRAAEQRITFVMDCFPKYQRGAEAHIHPMLQLTMPQLSERAIALVNGDRMLLAGAPEFIVNEPIEFTAPKVNHQRWFATGEEEFAVACGSICIFISQWVLPFLSEVSTPEDLIKVYETNDSRMMRQKHWYIFVAAAYLVLGRKDQAQRLVQQQFGSPGLKKRYAALFASLAIE